MKQKAGLTLANRITLLRMLLVPPFVITLVEGLYGTALVLGFFVGLSDAVDGWIARRWGQRTRLGSILDPLADKLLLVSTFAALAFRGDVPVWVLVVVLSKDVVVGLGWGLLFVLKGSDRVETRASGKAATAAQMLYAGTVILGRALGPESRIWTAGVPFFEYAAVALTAFSLLDYVAAGSRRLA